MVRLISAALRKPSSESESMSVTDVSGSARGARGPLAGPVRDTPASRSTSAPWRSARRQYPAATRRLVQLTEDNRVQHTRA